MSLLEINKFMLKQAQDKLNSINAVLKDNKNQRNSIIDIIRPKKKELISYEELGEIYYGHGKGSMMTKERKLRFILNEEKEIEKAKKLGKYKIPPVKEINLRYVQEDNKDIRELLIAISAKKHTSFEFNNYKAGIILCRGYIIQLREVALNTLKTFQVWQLRTSATEFCKLVNASRRCKSVCFNACILETDTKCGFGDMQNCQIQEINLLHSGLDNYSNWGERPIRFLNIIDAIADCAYLKNSLKLITFSKKDIYAFKNEISEEEIEKYYDFHIKKDLKSIMKKYKLDHIKVDLTTGAYSRVRRLE